MFTAKEAAFAWCSANGRTEPSREDLSKIGHEISKDFKNTWAGVRDPGLIKDTGFVVQIESSRKMIVSGYPDLYRSHADAVVRAYFINKTESQAKAPFKNEAGQSPEKRDRKRIPAKVTSSKVWKGTAGKV